VVPPVPTPLPGVVEFPVPLTPAVGLLGLIGSLGPVGMPGPVGEVAVGEFCEPIDGELPAAGEVVEEPGVVGVPTPLAPPEVLPPMPGPPAAPDPLPEAPAPLAVPLAEPPAPAPAAPCAQRETVVSANTQINPEIRFMAATSSNNLVDAIGLIHEC
jgi:hypothetical protein